MAAVQPASYAAGVRRRFEDLPPPVVDWVAVQLGGPVARVRPRVGGFSPGVAAVVTGTSGQALFVKAVGAAVNADALAFYRAELLTAARLPEVAGIVRPSAGVELLVEDEAYVVMAFPALDGAPPRHPWQAGDLERVLDALYALSVQLSPSPWPASESDQKVPDFFRSWERIVADGDDPWSQDPWVGARAPALVAAEEQLRAELVGETLSHTDLRADNVLLTSERVWFVDWAHAHNAAPWVDAALLLADVIASHADREQGGTVDLAAVIKSHPALRGVGHEVVWRLVVGLAGALHGLSSLPSPPGLPTIRGWQASTADTLLAWCRRTVQGGFGP